MQAFRVTISKLMHNKFTLSITQTTAGAIVGAVTTEVYNKFRRSSQDYTQEKIVDLFKQLLELTEKNLELNKENTENTKAITEIYKSMEQHMQEIKPLSNSNIDTKKMLTKITDGLEEGGEINISNVDKEAIDTVLLSGCDANDNTNNEGT